MGTPTKYRNRVVFSVTLAFFSFMANLAFAETKVFEEEYTYQASEADSKLSSRVITFEQGERLLLEKLGTYLESEAEVKNFQLTKDQIDSRQLALHDHHFALQRHIPLNRIFPRFFIDQTAAGLFHEVVEGGGKVSQVMHAFRTFPFSDAPSLIYFTPSLLY